MHYMSQDVKSHCRFLLSAPERAEGRIGASGVKLRDGVVSWLGLIL